MVDICAVKPLSLEWQKGVFSHFFHCCSFGELLAGCSHFSSKSNNTSLQFAISNQHPVFTVHSAEFRINKTKQLKHQMAFHPWDPELAFYWTPFQVGQETFLFAVIEEFDGSYIM